MKLITRALVLTFVLSMGSIVNASAQTLEVDYANWLASQDTSSTHVGLVKADPVIKIARETTYTIDVSRSSQNVFKLFGETASTHPVMNYDLVIEKGSWSTELFVTRPIGHHDEGEVASLWDWFGTRNWESGKFSGTVAVEVFYAPAQLGNPSSLFISPLATVNFKANDHFSIEAGAQWVGTHHTNYDGGDRVYGWIEPKVSFDISRLSVSLSPGYILANTGRSTLYASGDLTFNFTDSFSAYASYLEARSWGMGEGGMVPINGTWTLGLTVNF